jgi:hypothetical protein
MGLRSWLVDEVGLLRGRVDVAGGVPRPGELGAADQALLVMLGSGAGSALVQAWVAWLRHGRKGVTAKLTRPDGASVELSAQRVRDLDSEQLTELLADLARFVDGADPGGDGAGPG